jgi:hypothetical protein
MNDTLFTLPPIAAPTAVTVGIPLIAAVVALAACIGYAIASRSPGDRSLSLPALGRALAWFVAWSALAGGVASSGVLLRMDVRPPPFAFLFVALFALGFSLGFGPVGRRLMRLPVAALVGIHAFRLPLELVMHRAAIEGVMPVQMSYAGWNFDILTGLTAIVVAFLAAKGRAPRGLVAAWNALGTTLLIVILTIAMVSSPLFQLFGSAPRQVNTWVAHFPFVYLPTVLVVVAIAGHVTLWRKLLANPVHDAAAATPAEA